MTISEAIKILHPDTSRDALWEIAYYKGFSGKEAQIKAINEACLIACECMSKVEDKTTK